MNDTEIAAAFARNGAIYENGHFVYTEKSDDPDFTFNGPDYQEFLFHGPNYVDKEFVELDPIDTSNLCREIAIRLPPEPFYVDAVVGPEVGAIALAHSLSWHISQLSGQRISTIFARKGEGKSFTINQKFRRFLDGLNVLLVEDILNSGGSAGQGIAAIRALGGNVVGLGALCNRGGVKPADVGLTESDVFITLYNVQFPKYPVDKDGRCQLCKAGVPIDRRAGHWEKYLKRRNAL